MMTWSITSRLRLTKDKVELGKLSVPDFLVHRVPVVDVRLHTETAGLHQIDYFPVQRNGVGTRYKIQDLSFSNVPCIIVVQWGNRDNHSLTRRKPEWPFSWGIFFYLIQLLES